MLNKCDPSSLTQRWNTSAGDPSVVTTVQSEASGNCCEINGCSGPDIDTNYGCKKLPVGPPPWKGCNNMAWIFTPNGSIVSAMPSVAGGPLDQCLQVSAKDNVTVMLDLCQGAGAIFYDFRPNLDHFGLNYSMFGLIWPNFDAEREVWSVKGSAIESSLGGCIDDAPNPAVNASTVGTANCNTNAILFFEYSIENAEVMENCP